jgi:hypothetical protein
MCSAASVFVSWTCNKHSIKHDTIGFDFTAAILIPSVAAIHHHIELSKKQKENAQPAIETLDATRRVIEWFSAGIGLWMLYYARMQGWRKRSLCAGISNTLCLSAQLALSVRHDLLRLLPSPSSTVLFAMACNISALVSAPIAHNVILGSRWNDACWTQLRGFLKDGFRGSRIVGLAYLLYLPGGMMWLPTAVFRSQNSDRSLRGYPTLVPQTGNSLTELDQAMALALGVLTLIFSIYEALLSWRLKRGDYFRNPWTTLENTNLVTVNTTPHP